MAVLAADLDRAAEGDRPAIHRVRVASRRLRAALPIAAASSDARVAALLRNVRRVTRALAKVREMDVIRKVLRRLAAEGVCSPASLARLDEHAADLRDKGLARARARLDRVPRADVADRVNAAVRTVRRADAAPVAAELVGEIKRRGEQFLDALDAAGVVYAVEPLHQVRLAAKKLRYTLELAHDLFGEQPAQTARQLKHFQEVLGDLHDAQMAQQFVRDAAVAARLQSWDLPAVDRELELTCRRLHGRVVRQRAGLETTLRRLLVLCALYRVPRRAAKMEGGRRQAARGAGTGAAAGASRKAAGVR
jgi:CHAD domain-containing protein